MFADFFLQQHHIVVVIAVPDQAAVLEGVGRLVVDQNVHGPFAVLDVGRRAQQQIAGVVVLHPQAARRGAHDKRSLVEFPALGVFPHPRPPGREFAVEGLGEERVCILGAQLVQVQAKSMAASKRVVLFMRGSPWKEISAMLWTRPRNDRGLADDEFSVLKAVIARLVHT